MIRNINPQFGMMTTYDSVDEMANDLISMEYINDASELEVGRDYELCVRLVSRYGIMPAITVGVDEYGNYLHEADAVRMFPHSGDYYPGVTIDCDDCIVEVR